MAMQKRKVVGVLTKTKVICEGRRAGWMAGGDHHLMHNDM